MHDIVKEAADNCREYYSFFSEFLDVARDDSNFINGDQWTAEDKIKRRGRVMEVINDAKITKRRTIEDYDQKRSQIKIRANRKEDCYIADAMQGLIYSIHNDSMAEAVKDQAMSDMLDCGIGFYKWVPEYERLSFNQKLKIKPISNKFNIFIDIMNPSEIDGSDISWAGEVFYLTKEEMEKKYPKASLTPFPFLDQDSDQTDKIPLCEYYRVEIEKDKLLAIYSPFTDEAINVFADEINFEDNKELYDYYIDNGLEGDVYEWLKETGRIVAERDVERKKIGWYIINGDEILDQTTIGGEYIPIIPMLGGRYSIDGVVYFDSLIRQSKAPTRLNNLVLSNYVEVMSADPIAPYITDFRKIKNYLPYWNNANNKPIMALPFDPVVQEDGSIDAMPPQRQIKGDVPAGWATIYQMTTDAKTRTSGLPDSAQGLQGNEVSGIAVTARTDNGLANRSIFFKRRHFSDLLLGKQLASAIPVYYDEDRIIEVSEISGKTKTARIGKENHADGEGQFKGKYIDFKKANVTTYVAIGPSYGSQRQETTEKLLSILPLTPERYLDVIYPRFLRNVDIMDSEDMYEDAMKVAPEAIRETGEEKTPQQLQGELSQAQEQIQMLTQQNQEFEKMLLAEKQKIESQEGIAQMRVTADMQKEQMKQESATQRDLLSIQKDIKITEMEAKSRKEIELIKQSMSNMSQKMDMLITAITAKGEK